MKKILLLSAIVILFLYSNAQQSVPNQRYCDSKYSSFGLTGKPISDALDFIGSTHNEYQEYLLNSMVSSNIKPGSSKFQNFIKSLTIGFFQKKGIDASHLPSIGKLDLLNPTLEFGTRKYSVEGNSILNELRNLLSQQSTGSSEELISRLKILKEKVLLLSDETELIALGGTLSVAIYSTQYWSINLAKWENYLVKESGVSKKKNACLGAIGFADVSGAINGAYGGVAFGPGGALAGGVLGSAVSSSGAAIGCALSNLFDWW